MIARGASALVGHLVLVALALAAVALASSTSSGEVVVALARIDVGGAALLGGLAAALEAHAQARDDARVSSSVGRALALATGVLLFVVLVMAPALRLTAPASASGPLATFGALLAAAGAVLRAQSIRALGAAFVTEHDDAPRLVTSHVYARVRHPSELGLIALTLGMTALAPTLVGSIAAALLIALVGPRIAREERRLAASLGASYADYASRVPALLPRLT